MKKLLFILAIILCIALVSCDSAPDQTESTEPLPADSTDTVTLEGTAPPSEQSDPPSEEPAPPSEEPGGHYDCAKICTVHVLGYHGFPDWIINYAGKDDFNAWMEEIEDGEAVDGCPHPNVTMYDAIREFNVPREVFAENYYAIDYFDEVHNIDLLYGDDKSAADQFYRNEDELQAIVHKRQGLLDLKVSLFWRYNATWDDVIGHRNLNEVSVEQIVNAFDVPRDILESLAERSEVSGQMYDYNFDVIYSKDTEVVTPNDADSDVVSAVFVADAAFCGVVDYDLE